MSIKAGLGGDIINFVICVVAFFIIGYFVAYFMIGKFKFATPGRLGNYMDDNADVLKSDINDILRYQDCESALHETILRYHSWGILVHNRQ